MKKQIKEIVRQILIENPTTRKDDFKLIYHVIDKITGCARFMMLSDVANSHVQYRIPSFESITRARRLIQKEMPELKDEVMVEIREKEEQYFKNEFRK